MSSPSFSSLPSDSISHRIPLSSSTPSGTSSGAIGSSTGAVIVTTLAPQIEEFLRSGITQEEFEEFLRFCFTEEEFKKFIRRGSTQKDFEYILSLGITREELKEFFSLGITRDEFERFLSLGFTRDEFERFLSLGFTREEFKEFLRSDITREEFKELLRFSITKEEFVNEKKDDLYYCITNRFWNAVLEIYSKYKVFVQTANIINADGTALHLALSEGKIEEAKKLLKIIDDHAVRKMTNNRNENPLHLAVLLGETKMCKLLVDKDPELIAARNKDGETPLFLAAKHGKKRAFYALHPECPIKENRYIKHDIFHCKRNDGSSILHITILGEYFDLAFQIIFWYPELITYKNERGQTALHLLAQNPLAFRSGTDLGLVEDFIYRCLIVESAKIEMPSDYDDHCSDNTFSVQRNYKICLDFLNARKKIIKHAIVNWARKWKGIASNKDVEKQPLPVEFTGEDKNPPMEEPNQDNSDEDTTPNCFRDHISVWDVWFRVWRFDVSEVLDQPSYSAFERFMHFAIELLGFFQVSNIKEKKRKHTMAEQVMELLIPYAKDADIGSTSTTLDSNRITDVNHPPTNTNDHSNHPHQPSQGERESSEIKILTQTMEKMNDLLNRMIESQEKILTVWTKSREKDIHMKDARDTAMPSMTTGTSVQGKESSPFLIAAKMGVVEIVRTFLNYSPIVIHQEDADKKNALMLAVENKHPNTYKLLLENCRPSCESVFQKVDNNGNNAFHLAATVVEDHPWRIRGTALQIQWELKWYKHIQSSVPHQLFALRNNNGKTSREVFDDAHKEMVKDGAKWLTKTAQSCSVVAALIASVVYASATTVPGGVKEGTGIPLLRSQPAFNIFTVSSLVALCLSVTSLTVFLSILTSRYHVSNFLHYLPIKLLLGLTSLFVSIAAMLVSFCAGHFFDLSDQLRQRAYLIYAITCFPVTVYAATQFPLYFDLIKSIKTKVPQRNHMSSTI